MKPLIRSTRPIVSGEHLLFEVAVVRGAALAELALWAGLLRPFTEAGRMIGIAFRDAAESLSRGIAAYNRALRQASGRPDKGGT